MNSWVNVIWSSMGRKVISALTGLGLFIFLIFHLLGNLQLLYDNPQPFNEYSHFLISLGGALYIIEIALLLSFVFHAIMGIAVWIGKKKARPGSYEKVEDAGAPSRKTISSKTMIYTGIITLAFLIFHIVTFKYGPGIDDGYVAKAGDTVMRDLYRLVIEYFNKTWVVILYVVCMVLLGFHLRHAVWSAFQSLGISQSRLLTFLFRIALVAGIIIGFGYLLIPLWIYFNGGAA
ncbi:MAG: succinate dehydrogenase [candidate division Zixibacteria bacterium]|nr:succinate dehydrogenase [candidate division Zixibacteria bacterium]